MTHHRIEREWDEGMTAGEVTLYAYGMRKLIHSTYAERCDAKRASPVDMCEVVPLVGTFWLWMSYKDR